MAFRDTCIILKRFPIGENSLLLRCYSPYYGQNDLIASEYFLGKKYKLGIFEPFNLIHFYSHEKNSQLLIADVINYKFFSLSISVNFPRYLFISKVFKTILSFIPYGDREIFELLLEALRIKFYFNFNLIRFWINLATVLGFSLENLNKPGWVNAMFLTQCGKNELKNPYCVYLSPTEFSLIKRIRNINTKPFEVKEKNVKALERFFFKFFKLQRENF